MREHMGLYRGKRKDNGKWAEGYLYEHEPPLQGVVPKGYTPPKSRWFIVKTAFADWNMPRQVEFIEVDPDTVGECTGLPDVNGKLIFEGDIFHLEDELIAVIVFKDGSFRLQVYGFCGTCTENGYDECGGSFDIIECDPIDWYNIHDMEIIGNIHDNPELLGSEG